LPAFKDELILDFSQGVCNGSIPWKHLSLKIIENDMQKRKGMYTKNPAMPRLRAKAVIMVRSGVSVRQTARYFGYHPGTVSKWMKRARFPFPARIGTDSSKPHYHPNSLKPEIIERIVYWRRKTRRCSEVIYEYLKRENISVSLSSVKRTLKREHLIRKRSPWKRWHSYPEKPLILNAGDLVCVDTIHLMKDIKERIYVFTLIDLYSRLAYAKAFKKSNTKNARLFVLEAKEYMNFDFKNIQSDHGSEFSTHFTERIKIPHRHSRVRRPTDNGCLERFNRTIQEEFLDYIPKNVRIINRRIVEYLRYYNNERLHLGIGLKTPIQMLKCFQGAG